MKYKILFNSIFSNSLFKNTGIYSFGTLINSAIPFLLIPILTKYLSPEDYGLISIYGLLLAFVSPFIGYNIHSSISRMYFSNTKEELSEYIGNCFLVLFVSIIFTCIFFLFIQNWLSKSTLLPINWVWSSIILAITQFVILIPLTLWQVQNKPVYFAVFQIFSTVLNFGFTIFFLIILKWNWTSRIEAQILSGLVFALISVYYLIKDGYIKINYNKTYFQNAIKFGIPLIPHAVGGIFLSIVNRYFLVKYVGLKETGFFFLAFQLTSIINILTSALNTAYLPWLFEKLEKNNEHEKKEIVKFTYKYFIFLILGSLVFIYLVPLILKYFVGNKFLSSEKYFFWLILASVFNGMYLMVTNYIFYVKKTYILAWITFSSSLFTISLNYILIKNIGAIGSAISSAIGFAILFIATWILSARVYQMPWFNFLNKQK